MPNYKVTDIKTRFVFNKQQTIDLTWPITYLGHRSLSDEMQQDLADLGLGRVLESGSRSSSFRARLLELYFSSRMLHYFVINISYGRPSSPSKI